MTAHARRVSVNKRIPVGPRHAMTIRFDHEAYSVLFDLAERDERPMNWIANKLFSYFLLSDDKHIQSHVEKALAPGEM